MDEFSWLYDIGFVRWLSGFFTEEKLGPVFRWFRAQLEGRTPSQMAAKFLGWAITLALLAAIIDQAIYWTRRDQRSKLLRFAAHTKLLWRRFYRFAAEKLGGVRWLSPGGRR